MRARALQLVHRRLAPLLEVIRAKRRRVLARQSETIAADRYADRPRAAVDSLGDSDLRVVHLDHAPGGPNLEVEKRLVKHEGRRPSVRRVAGANETVGLEPLRRRDRQDLRHDLAGVACRRADLDPLASEVGDDLRRAGDEVRVARRDRDVLRHERGVDSIDVRLCRRMPVTLRPSFRHSRQRHDGDDMRPLGHAHRAARFFDRDCDAELGEGLHERAHRGERAVIDDGAGPIENDGLDALHSSLLQSKSSAITSSAIANDVLAPVPLVIRTMRNPSHGASTSINRSEAEA